MGNKVGTPVPYAGVLAVANLPAEALESLWLSYSLNGEAYGLELVDMKAIFEASAFLMDKTRLTDDDMSTLFDIFDTDTNGVIDALELFVTLALISGMTTAQKVDYVFRVYDFAQAGEMTLDEVVLMMRSMASGLDKVAPSKTPFVQAEVDAAAQLVFSKASKVYEPEEFLKRVGTPATTKITRDEFKTYLVTHPVMASILRYYSRVAPSGKNVVTLAAAPAPAMAAPAPAMQALAEADSTVPWNEAADLNKPEELPPVRLDAPEDSLEPVWIHGYTATRTGTVKYTATGGVIFTAGGTVVVQERATPAEDAEEGAVLPYGQRYFFDHFPNTVTTVATDASGEICATGDNTGRVYVWKTAPGAAPSLNKAVVASPYGGITQLSLSRCGTVLAVVGSDVNNTLTTYDVSNFSAVTTRSVTALGAGSVADVAVCGASSLVAVACATQTSCGTGVDLFTTEDSWTGSIRRPALLEGPGSAVAIGAATTALSYVGSEMDLVSGNTAGQVLLWSNGSCVQVIAAHGKDGQPPAAVVTIAYNVAANQVVSSASDGTVAVFGVTTSTPVGDEAAFAQLELLATMDSMMLSCNSSDVRAAVLSNDGAKCLVGVASGEIAEMSAIAVPLPKAEGEEEEAPPGEEGEDAAPKPRGTEPGDELNGGPIVRSHAFAQAGNGDVGTNSIISGVAKVAGGFLTVGKDGSVNQWSAAEGAEHKLAVQTRLDAPGLNVTVSPTGAHVAVGMGAQRDGAITVLNTEGLTNMCIVKGLDGTVNHTAFSPDGTHLAASCQDGSVYLYVLGVEEVAPEPEAPAAEEAEAPAEGAAAESEEAPVEEAAPAEPTEPKPAFIFKTKLSQETVGSWGVTCSDFSQDATLLRVLLEDGSLTYFSLKEGEGGDIGTTYPNPEVPETVDAVKAAQWQSNVFAASWELKGLWKKKQNTAFDRAGNLVANCSVDGTVVLQRVPCVEAGVMPADMRVPAHTGAVSAVCFIGGEEGLSLVTAGGDDGIVQVWRVTVDAEEVEPAATADDGGADEDGPIAVGYDSCDDEDRFDGADVLQPFKQALAPAPEPSAEPEPEPVKAPVEGDEEEGEEGDAKPKVTKPLAPIAIFDEAPGATLSAWVEGAGTTAEAVAAEAPAPLATTTLELENVLGYSARTTRGAVKYSPEGRILYPAAATVVVLDKKSGKQSHFMGHDDEVTCLDVHAASGLCATGQRSASSVKVCVWAPDADNALRATVDLGAVVAASAVAFSPDGRFLAVTCQDAAHSIVVVDWAAGVVRAKAVGGESKALSVAFSQATDATGSLRVLVGGVNAFSIHELGKSRAIVSKTGKYGEGSKKPSALCVLAVPLAVEGGNEFLMGMSDGTIGTVGRGERRAGGFTPCFEGGRSVTSMSLVTIKEATAEEPPVYKVIVGGTDGQLKVVDPELNAVEGFPEGFHLYKGKSPIEELYDMGAPRGVKSVCVDKAQRKFVCGTAGGEIFELDLKSLTDVNDGKGSLVTGHCRDQVLGMATHPIRQECATVGDDCTLRVWDVAAGRVITTLELPDIARSVAYSPNGQIIVVGLGGTVVRKGRRLARVDEDDVIVSKMCVVSFLQNKLQIVFETSDAAGPITAIAFSAAGDRVFAGSTDGSVYEYDPLNDFTLTEVLKGHTEAVESIELSPKCHRLLSRGVGNETMMWKIDEKKPAVVAADALVAECAAFDAAVRKTPYWCDSAGVHAPAGGLASRVTSMALSASGKERVMATGERGGAVKVFAYPSTAAVAPFHLYRGHSTGGVSSVGFTQGDARLVTVGADDRTLFVWKVVKDKRKPIEAKAVPKAKSGTDLAASIAEGYKSAAGVLGFPTQAFTALAVPEPAAAVPAEVEEAAPAPVIVPAPSAALSLQRLIGGYAVNVSKDFICGPEARYGPDGLVVSAAANTIVSTIVDSGVQNAWPIAGAQYGLCPLTVTASRRFTLAAPRAPVGGSATAKSIVKDASLTGSVTVYNTVTGAVVKSLMAVPGAGTTAAAFSACGKWAAVVGKDTGAFSTLYIFYSATAEWTDGVSIASNIVDSKGVSQVAFCGGAAGAIAAPLLMTGGKAATRFWTLLGGNLSSCAAGEKMEGSVTSCVAQGSGGVVTGHADGTIAFWSGSALAMAVPGAHEGAVTCLTVEGTKLVSGSSDGVKVWEMNSPESTGLTNSAAFSMDSFGAMLGGGALASPFSLRPFVTCVDTDPLMTRMLVSLSSNVTFEFALDSKRAVKIHEGHSAGGITSIAAHPTDPTTVVTVGADKLLKVWDLSQPSGPVVVETHVLVHPPTCAVFKSDGFELAVAVEGADTNGNYAALLIMKYDPAMRLAITPGSSQGEDFTCLTTEVKVHNVGVGKVSAIRYSADNKFVAAVSEDKSVYIYSVETGFKTTGALPGNSAAVSGVDFSASGNFVRTFAAMDADTIASGAAVPTVMFFDLGQKTRANAGTAIALDDLPDGETFATSAGPYCKNTQGLLCCAAGAGARAILGMKTSGTHVLATLSDGSIAITTAAAAAATDTLSAGNGVAHIIGATQADFLAGGEMVVSAGAEGSMAIWTVC